MSNPTPSRQTNLQFPDSNPRQADGAVDISGQFAGLGEDVDKLGPGSPYQQGQGATTSQEGLDIAIGADN